VRPTENSRYAMLIATIHFFKVSAGNSFRRVDSAASAGIPWSRRSLTAAESYPLTRRVSSAADAARGRRRAARMPRVMRDGPAEAQTILTPQDLPPRAPAACSPDRRQSHLKFCDRYHRAFDSLICSFAVSLPLPVRESLTFALNSLQPPASI
jgi:hypothetical protein